MTFNRRVYDLIQKGRVKRIDNPGGRRLFPCEGAGVPEGKSGGSLSD